MKVLVTGASGYIAGFCVADLLEHGHEVRGTVRDPSNREKVAHLDALGEIELVAADLTSDDGWAAAMEGVDAVMHTASPFSFGPTEEEMVPPAVNGTLRVLKAAQDAGVRRVVVTSSTASVVNNDPGPDGLYTEEVWSDPERCSPYPKSKTLAEKAAWDFVEEHPELELVTCNPCLVLGPLQHGRRHSLSIEPIKRVLSRSMPAVPKLGFSVIDVRDVASAHRLALETPEAAGNRYILFSGFLWMNEVGEILKEAFGSEGYNPPTRILPYPLLWLAARFDAGLKTILPDIGVHRKLTSAKAREELSWTPRDPKTAVVDCGRSLIDVGLV